MPDKKTRFPRLTVLAGALLLGACTVLPTGPSVMVLPGTGQSMERFREDDQYCRQYSHIQIGGKTAGEASRESAVTSAAVGAAIGAVAGAAIGGDGYAAPIRQRVHPVHVQQGSSRAGAGQHGLPARGAFYRRGHTATTTGCATSAASRRTISFLQKNNARHHLPGILVFGFFFQLTVEVSSSSGWFA